MTLVRITVLAEDKYSIALGDQMLSAPARYDVLSSRFVLNRGTIVVSIDAWDDEELRDTIVDIENTLTSMGVYNIRSVSSGNTVTISFNI